MLSKVVLLSSSCGEEGQCFQWLYCLHWRADPIYRLDPNIHNRSILSMYLRVSGPSRWTHSRTLSTCIQLLFGKYPFPKVLKYRLPPPTPPIHAEPTWPVSQLEKRRYCATNFQPKHSTTGRSNRLYDP